MRKFKIYSKSFLLLAASVLLLTVSCEEDDVVTGSPNDSGIPYTALRGIITSTDTEVVANQVFPITVSLGDNPDTPEVDLLTFPIDVNVEVVAEIPNTSKRTRRTVVIPAGENSAEGEAIAPSGDATGELPFSLDMNLFLTAITSGTDEDIIGFAGKQYTIASDTLSFGYGTSALGAINPTRFAFRFDWEGPWATNNPARNNVDILLKKNGAVIPSLSSMRGVSSSASSPLNGSLTFNQRAEVLNWLDTDQTLKISNETVTDSIAGIYTVRSVASSTAANDKPHGYKAGDQVTIGNFAGTESAPFVVTIATVPNPYTFTFSFTDYRLNEGISNSFYQPVIKPRLVSANASEWSSAVSYEQNDAVVYLGVTYWAVNDIIVGTPGASSAPSTSNSRWTTARPNELWSPFLAYLANESVQLNNVTYYCLRNIAVNPAGNLAPNLDSVNWTTVKPKFNWLSAPPVSTSWTPSVLYRANQVVSYTPAGGTTSTLYVCISEHNSANNSRPDNDVFTQNNPQRWTPVSVQNNGDIQGYTSTDTFIIEAYARTLRGASTVGTTIPSLPYRMSVRYPTGEAKVYKDVFTDLTVQSAGTAIPANGLPIMQIIKTTVQGTSTYVVTPL